MKIKYSIVIPTYNHLNDCLIPCINSILKNTSLEDKEIIIVANGCIDDTEHYVKKLSETIPNIKLISYSCPLGYTIATNIGIKAAIGKFIILMNNDCQVLDFCEKDEWIKMLEQPFIEDDKTGISGPSLLFSKETNRKFVIFFLAMIKKSLFEEIGYLDEIFNPGGSEDIDFSMRTEKAGYLLKQVPQEKEKWEYVTTFPLYHAAEQTVFGIPNWEDIFKSHTQILEDRKKQFYYDEFADVTAYVSTKGRYLTTLPSCLISIANQTKKPKYLIVFQDDHESFNMQESSVYKNIFGLFQRLGIEWAVIYGEGKGQVLNHQKALDIAKSEWLWRIDDDNVLEANVLEGLCNHIKDNIGAVASAVIDPLYTPGKNMMVSYNKIKDINIAPNFQWAKSNEVIKAEHLYSTFLYRKIAGKHGYNKELSPVGHREETLFTHEMHRNGWDLIIDTNLVTYHLRENSGGIRSYNDNSLWDKDESIFNKKLLEWSITPSNTKFINMDCGIGDHWIFKPVLEKILNDTKDNVIIASCYPAVYEDLEKKYPNFKQISIAEGNAIYGQQKMDSLNVYKYCNDYGWDGPIVGVFEKMYLK